MRKREIADKNIEGYEYKMSYQEALEAVGARVIAFQEFGDWQGTWIALVEYRAGVRREKEVFMGDIKTMLSILGL